ncbi:sulfate-binding protein, partial [Fischerella thermalis WC542]
MSSWQRVITKSRQTLLKITSRVRVNSIKGFLSLALVGVSLSVAIASCSGGNGNGTADDPTANPVAAGNNKQDVEITLVSFAVTRAAYDTILPKFVEKWKQEHNQNVSFNRSYGGSGSQTRAVIDGLEADIVHLALALDTQKIEKAGLIEPGWEKELPNNAVVS